MKRWMAPLLITLMLGTSVFAAEQEIWEQWKSSPEYEKYSKLDPKSEEAKKLKEEAITRITKIVLHYSELSNRSREWIRKKIETYPLQIKTILSDLYLKSDKVLETKNQKIPFNSGMFLLIDAIHNWWWNSEVLAINMKRDFTFNDGGKFINDLVEIGKSADEIAQYRRETAKSQTETAKWLKIIETLNKL